MWQLIETAPKDGTVIDLWNAACGCRVENASWFGGVWIAPDAPIHEDDDVTHWMPLPEPPSSNGEVRGEQLAASPAREAGEPRL